MKSYKKTFYGSLIAFFVGTSCCWISGLAIWLGGAAFAGMAVRYIQNLQLLILSLGIILLILAFIQYARRK